MYGKDLQDEHGHMQLSDKSVRVDATAWMNLSLKALF
jgi:hypothetical protein